MLNSLAILLTPKFMLGPPLKKSGTIQMEKLIFSSLE
jgi:hypothetical protein